MDVLVTGRVQGVFFRGSCAGEARRLGVRGWVGNEPDGSVRGYFVGAAEAVDALVDWCRAGSPGARVERVDVAPASVRDARGFETR